MNYPTLPIGFHWAPHRIMFLLSMKLPHQTLHIDRKRVTRFRRSAFERDLLPSSRFGTPHRSKQVLRSKWPIGLSLFMQKERSTTCRLEGRLVVLVNSGTGLQSVIISPKIDRPDLDLQRGAQWSSASCAG